MHSTTKIGIQVALAVAIAVLVMHFSHFQKSYWCGMIVLLMFSTSMGENNFRVIVRVLWTVIGGVVATFSAYFLHPPMWLTLIVVCIVLYYLLRYLFSAYVWGVFIGMFFVVYLYLILGEWNFHVLESRIFETILAGIIVIAVSIILPVRVGEKIKPSTIRIIMGIQDIISEMRDAVLEEKKYCPSFTKGSQLMVLGNSMRTLILAARFENIFSSNKDKIAKRMIRSFQNYHISVEVLANALAHTQNSKLIKEKYLLFFNLVIEKSESMNKMFDAYFHHKVSKVKEESLNFSKINSEIISIGSPYSEMKFCTVDEKIDMFEIELKIKELSREMNFLKKWLIKLDQD